MWMRYKRGRIFTLGLLSTYYMEYNKKVSVLTVNLQKKRAKGNAKKQQKMA